MARTLAIPYKRFEGLRVSPSLIQADEEQNGRAFNYNQADLADLLADLRSGKGIKTPVEIVPVPIEGGTGARLKIGFRRWLAACEYLKENPEYLLPCVWGESKDAQGDLEDNARENAHRKNLSIIDQGHVALRLQGEPTTSGGRTLEEISEILSVSVAQVGQAIKLVSELPQALQKEVHTKGMTASDAFVLLKVPEPARAEAMAQAEAVVQAPPERPKLGRGRPPGSSAVRQIAEDAGARLTRNMSQLKKYLQMAIDEDGPGSNKGEVALKGALLAFIAGELTERQMDTRFGVNCKVKV